MGDGSSPRAPSPGRVRCARLGLTNLFLRRTPCGKREGSLAAARLQRQLRDTPRQPFHSPPRPGTSLPIESLLRRMCLASSLGFVLSVVCQEAGSRPAPHPQTELHRYPCSNIVSFRNFSGDHSLRLRLLRRRGRWRQPSVRAYAPHLPSAGAGCRCPSRFVQVPAFPVVNRSGPNDNGIENERRKLYCLFQHGPSLLTSFRL